MLKNYLTVIFRNIFRQKVFSAINIFGFAIGLAICMIITFYIIDDLSYDRFHHNSDNIYRLLTKDTSTTDLMYGITSGKLMEGIKDGVPEVEASTRITFNGREEIRYYEPSEEAGNIDPVHVRTLIADKNFFNVFSFSIISGNSIIPLDDPGGIYLIPEKAQQIFGEEDPIGKRVEFMGIEDAYVAGIVNQPPTNSSIRFECIVPLRIEWSPIWWDSWTNVALTGYVRLKPDSDIEIVEKKIIDFASQNGFAKIWQPKLQKLTDIHLRSGNLRFDTMNWGRSDISKVISTAIIAFLVLIIATINFINLSGARATKRVKEVGMRKVIGSNRRNLIIQFLLESLLITYIAAIIASVIFEISIPFISVSIHKDCSLEIIQNPLIYSSVFAIISCIGLLAGIYPALIISAFKVMSVLKGNFLTSKKGKLLRRLLVVIQFAISISLISALFIVKSQIEYLNKIDLGYDRTNVFDLPFRIDDHAESYKARISELPEVVSIGHINSLPGGTLQKFQVFPEGDKAESGTMFDRLRIDEGLLETLKIKLLNGRNFSETLDKEDGDTVILNEAAVRFAGWSGDPIGKTVKIQHEDGSQQTRNVIGIVKDFNFTTTRRSVNPMFITYAPGNFAYLVRTNGVNNAEFLETVKVIYSEFYPDDNFGFEYFDDIFNYQFRQDQSFAGFIAVFSIIAIIISCLGLLGLSAFMTEQRTKEIGVRKVLGSSVFQVVKLLSVDFTKWVLLANIIAWPITWFALDMWLSEFNYRMNINIGFFLLSGFIVLLISIFTISFQTIKAANSDPVKALKYE